MQVMKEKIYDLTGKKFGNLTVIALSGRYHFGSPVWHCQCSCGNIISVWTENLINNTVTACPFCEDEMLLLEDDYSGDINSEDAYSEDAYSETQHS